METSSNRLYHPRVQARAPAKFSSLLAAMISGLFLLCSCGVSDRSMKFDVRQLQQPMVMNSNPFLGPTNGFSGTITNVATYLATNSFSSEGSRSYWTGTYTVLNKDGTTTTYDQYSTSPTTFKYVNQVQVSAFLQIGGQTNRFIHNIILKTDNGGGDVSLTARGDVAEFHSEVVTNTPAPSGGSRP
jgi:hypothetical protein